MKQDITLKEHKEFIKKVHDVALEDLNSFDMDNSNTVFSVLGVQLCCRNEEYLNIALEDEKCDYYHLFIRFNPDLMNYMKNKSKDILEYGFMESAENLFYWKVCKYVQVENTLCKMYETYFSLKGKVIGVEYIGTSREIPELENYLEFSDAQEFLRKSSWNLTSPRKVKLSYKPGDILHINASPFTEPFDVVYCSSHGKYGQTHPCLYIADYCDGLRISDLADCWFTAINHMVFPYAPLDRVKKINTCDDSRLLKVSKMLKENPDIIKEWLTIQNTHSSNDGGLEQWIFDE